MRIGTRGPRSIGSAALGLVLVGAALYVPAAAASAQEGQPAPESDSRLLLYVGLGVLTIGTVLVVAIRLRYLVRRGRNGASSGVPKPLEVVPASATSPTWPPSNGTRFVPQEPDLSLADLSLPERKPQSASNGSGAEAEPLSVALESEPESEASEVSTVWLERWVESEPVSRPNSTFDNKMQEFLRELRSYHK